MSLNNRKSISRSMKEAPVSFSAVEIHPEVNSKEDKSVKRKVETVENGQGLAPLCPMVLIDRLPDSTAKTSANPVKRASCRVKRVPTVKRPRGRPRKSPLKIMVRIPLHKLDLADLSLQSEQSVCVKTSGKRKRNGEEDLKVVSMTDVDRCGEEDLKVVSMTDVDRCGEEDLKVVSMTKSKKSKETGLEKPAKKKLINGEKTALKESANKKLNKSVINKSVVQGSNESVKRQDVEVEPQCDAGIPIGSWWKETDRSMPNLDKNYSDIVANSDLPHRADTDIVANSDLPHRAASVSTLAQDDQDSCDSYLTLDATGFGYDDLEAITRRPPPPEVKPTFNLQDCVEGPIMDQSTTNRDRLSTLRRICYDIEMKSAKLMQTPKKTVQRKPELMKSESMNPESMKPESMKPESMKPEPMKPESMEPASRLPPTRKQDKVISSQAKSGINLKLLARMQINQLVNNDSMESVQETTATDTRNTELTRELTSRNGLPQAELTGELTSEEAPSTLLKSPELPSEKAPSTLLKSPELPQEPVTKSLPASAAFTPKLLDKDDALEMPASLSDDLFLSSSSSSCCSSCCTSCSGVLVAALDPIGSVGPCRSLVQWPAENNNTIFDDDVGFSQDGGMPRRRPNATISCEGHERKDCFEWMKLLELQHCGEILLGRICMDPTCAREHKAVWLSSLIAVRSSRGLAFAARDLRAVLHALSKYDAPVLVSHVLEHAAAILVQLSGPEDNLLADAYPWESQEARQAAVKMATAHAHRDCTLLLSRLVPALVTTEYVDPHWNVLAKSRPSLRMPCHAVDKILRNVLCQRLKFSQRRKSVQCIGKYALKYRTEVWQALHLALARWLRWDELDQGVLEEFQRVLANDFPDLGREMNQMREKRRVREVPVFAAVRSPCGQVAFTRPQVEKSLHPVAELALQSGNVATVISTLAANASSPAAADTVFRWVRSVLSGRRLFVVKLIEAFAKAKPDTQKDILQHVLSISLSTVVQMERRSLSKQALEILTALRHAGLPLRSQHLTDIPERFSPASLVLTVARVFLRNNLLRNALETLQGKVLGPTLSDWLEMDCRGLPRDLADRNGLVMELMESSFAKDISVAVEVFLAVRQTQSNVKKPTALLSYLPKLLDRCVNEKPPNTDLLVKMVDAPDFDLVGLEPALVRTMVVVLYLRWPRLGANLFQRGITCAFYPQPSKAQSKFLRVTCYNFWTKEEMMLSATLALRAYALAREGNPENTVLHIEEANYSVAYFPDTTPVLKVRTTMSSACERARVALSCLSPPLTVFRTIRNDLHLVETDVARFLASIRREERCRARQKL